MKLAELKNKKILIVGKGIEGNAILKYLKKNLVNTVINIVDQKSPALKINTSNFRNTPEILVKIIDTPVINSYNSL